MNEGNVKFARNLVKGKIAETIFAQMYRESNFYTVLEFGYEKIVPELVQQGFNKDSGLIQTLTAAPDFAVINKEVKLVRLVEVKYRHKIDSADIFHDEKKMSDSWNPSYLFVATMDGFYFDEADDILKNNGKINRLGTEHISQEIQDSYLKILQDFERN